MAAVDGSCSIVFNNLAEVMSKNAEGKRIMDIRVQIVGAHEYPLYTRLLAKISLTGENAGNRSWATGMALADTNKFDFNFLEDQYLPFEGVAVSDAKFTISVDANSDFDFTNAKLVLFVTYSM